MTTVYFVDEDGDSIYNTPSHQLTDIELQLLMMSKKVKINGRYKKVIEICPCFNSYENGSFKIDYVDIVLESN
jgi:hypothetical protein